MCDSVNHTRFPKEDHLPDWVCRDEHGNKGDRVDLSSMFLNASLQTSNPTVYRIIGSNNDMIILARDNALGWLI